MSRIGAYGVLVLVLVGAGCSRGSPNSLRETPSDAGAPLDVETMAFLSMARALHHEANVLEESGDLRGAATRVERIVQAPAPRVGTAPEIEEVLADAWARLAELDVRLGDPTKAEEAARTGLLHARAPTYFRGHLLEVQGIAEEARSTNLADAGDAAGAAKARSSAMRLLEEAVIVQEEVIGRALDGGSDAEGER